MRNEPDVMLADLVASLSSAIDLVSPDVVNHHKQVGYIALEIGRELGLSSKEQGDLALAGALHDCGALALQERLRAMAFESSFGVQDVQRHAEIGFLLLSSPWRKWFLTLRGLLRPAEKPEFGTLSGPVCRLRGVRRLLPRAVREFDHFTGIADTVRHHHVLWEEGRGMERDGEAVPTSCHIVHLADRVAVLMDTKREILSQVPEILEVIKENAGRMFMPQLVDIVEGLASREGFWLDGVSVLPGRTWWHEARLPTVQLDMQGLLSLAQLFAGLIDFRSRFTATHSSGVAATAESLGRLAGFSPGECQLMRCAGLLHDLGKLAVPESILEKPGKLSHAEFNVIRAHTFYTYRVLEGISALQTINPWAAWHHERLDGAGYPFHISGEDMPLGSRVMAVADTATAVTEDRPYREGMAQDRALDVLRNSAGGSGLDADIVSLYEANFDEVNSARVGAQKAASARYEGLAA